MAFELPDKKFLLLLNLNGKGLLRQMNRLNVVTVLVSMIFLSSLVLLPLASADWSMFRSNSAHNGVGTGKPAFIPTLLWKSNTGGAVYSSPTVVNGVVYIGSLDGNVYALNSGDGAKIWNCTVGYEVWSSLPLPMA